MEDFWEDRPRNVQEQNSFEIVRTPPGGTICGIVASEKFVGVNLHYYRGRSTPCRKNFCDACEGGMRPRWTGYVFLMSKSKRIVIFEFTQRCYNVMQSKLIASQDDMRGAMLTARRLSTRPNGPLQITFEEERRDPAILPAVPDLREILERIWEVKQVELPFDLSNRMQDETSLPAPSRNGKPKAKR